jgi:hypothetical protein
LENRDGFQKSFILIILGHYNKMQNTNTKEATPQPKLVPVQTKTLDANQLAYVIQGDKQLMKMASEKCMRRCVLAFETEHLNVMEQNCVDRCVYKFDEMVRLVVDSKQFVKSPL